MSVPEAAVNEDGDLRFRKSEVGLSGKRVIPSPPRDMVGSENGDKPLLG